MPSRRLSHSVRLKGDRCDALLFILQWPTWRITRRLETNVTRVRRRKRKRTFTDLITIQTSAFLFLETEAECQLSAELASLSLQRSKTMNEFIKFLLHSQCFPADLQFKLYKYNKAELNGIKQRINWNISHKLKELQLLCRCCFMGTSDRWWGGRLGEHPSFLHVWRRFMSFHINLHYCTLCLNRCCSHISERGVLHSAALSWSFLRFHIYTPPSDLQLMLHHPAPTLCWCEESRERWAGQSRNQSLPPPLRFHPEIRASFSLWAAATPKHSRCFTGLIIVGGQEAKNRHYFTMRVEK